MTLRELLDGAVADLDDVRAAAAADGGTTWSTGTTVFAWLDAAGDVGDFRLDPAIAAAAARTPDTASSPRGPGWVRFRPAALDGHAADRAAAWFISAYRRTPRA